MGVGANTLRIDSHLVRDFPIGGGIMKFGTKTEDHVICIEEFTRAPEKGRYRLIKTGKGTMKIAKVGTHQ